MYIKCRFMIILRKVKCILNQLILPLNHHVAAGSRPAKSLDSCFRPSNDWSVNKPGTCIFVPPIWIYSRTPYLNTNSFYCLPLPWAQFLCPYLLWDTLLQDSQSRRFSSLKLCTATPEKFIDIMSQSKPRVKDNLCFPSKGSHTAHFLRPKSVNNWTLASIRISYKSNAVYTYDNWSNEKVDCTYLICFLSLWSCSWNKGCKSKSSHSLVLRLSPSPWFYLYKILFMQGRGRAWEVLITCECWWRIQCPLCPRVKRNEKEAWISVLLAFWSRRLDC